MTAPAFIKLAQSLFSGRVGVRLCVNQIGDRVNYGLLPAPMIILTLLPVLAPVVIATLIGVFWARSGADFPSDFVGRLVMNIGTPCLIVASLASAEIELASIGRVALAAAAVIVLTGLAGALVLRLWRLEQATYLPPLILPNNGNMGLPVCLFAFGDTGLALALGYFLVMMLATFTLGIVIVADTSRPSQTALGLLRQPVLWAMGLAVALLVTGAELPLWLSNTLELLGGFAIPLMMITLGVSLGRLKVRRWGRSLWLSAARIGGGLLVAWLVAMAMGLEGAERGVVLLQSAMPVAVFTYLLALRYERHHEEVAAMVVASTVLAFVALPVILIWVLG